MAKIAVLAVARLVKSKHRRPGRHAKKMRAAQKRQTFFTGGPCRRG